jgi:hypothetical protein
VDVGAGVGAAAGRGPAVGTGTVPLGGGEAAVYGAPSEFTGRSIEFQCALGHLAFMPGVQGFTGAL